MCWIETNSILLTELIFPDYGKVITKTQLNIYLNLQFDKFLHIHKIINKHKKPEILQNIKISNIHFTQNMLLLPDKDVHTIRTKLEASAC